MVGAPDDSQKVDALSLEEEVAVKKENLRRAFREFDPLASLKHKLRQNPFTTVGAAAVLGVVAASPAAARVKQTRKTSSGLRIGLRVATMAAQFVAAKIQAAQIKKAMDLQKSAAAAHAANLHTQDPAETVEAVS
jgi:hypothetical protein